jgi:putative flippase GtrA
MIQSQPRERPAEPFPRQRGDGSRLMAFKRLLRRAIKFGVTGVFVTACHAAYAVTAIELNGWTPPTANGFAFTFATFISYLVNTRWSFSREVSGRSLLRFWMVCCVGLAQSIAVSTAVEHAGMPYPVGIGLISVTVPPVSFMLHSLWTYRDSNPAPAPDAPAATRPPRNQARTAAGKPRRKNQRTRRQPYQRFSR